jgi:hypothetical protein
MILDPKQTGMLGEVIAEGGYYGMQTFDQHLLEHLQAGRITMEDAVRTASSPHDFKLMVAAQSRIGPRSHPNKGEGKIDGAPPQASEPHPASAPPAASQPPASPMAPPAAPPVAPPAAPPVATQPPVAPPAPPAPMGPPPGASAPPPGVPS